MSRSLPAWVIDMWAARASGNPTRILDSVDPLPESTVVALERSRKEAKRHDGGR